MRIDLAVDNLTLTAMKERAGIREKGDPVTPKRDRPRCGGKTKNTGAPCMRPVVWDYETDMPVNGWCRRHGGLQRAPE